MVDGPAVVLPVPKLPRQFFQDYLPTRFAAAASAAGVDPSSAGSVTFRLLDQGEEYSLRLDHGRLLCSTGMAEDTLLQVTLTVTDFERLFVGAAERAAGRPLDPERHLIALRALGIDSERAALVRQATGSVALELREGEHLYRVVLTPGSAQPQLEQPACRITLDYQDWLDIEDGKVVPLQLLLAGKLLIQGNAQPLMALVATLTGPEEPRPAQS
jgi:alkyl sulfatase BDS1-like metallo-beta-lactamase superfamily hydrolase